MPILIYDPNGATGGSVPPSRNYNSGDEVFVLGNTGGLYGTGFVFAYWNVKVDGSGTIYDPKGHFVITHLSSARSIRFPASARSRTSLSTPRLRNSLTARTS